MDRHGRLALNTGEPAVPIMNSRPNRASTPVRARSTSRQRPGLRAALCRFSGAYQPSLNTYEHLRTPTNTYEHLRTPTNTYEHLRTLTNANHASRLTPHASRITPHASRITPHASRLTPHPSLSKIWHCLVAAARVRSIPLPKWFTDTPRRTLGRSSTLAHVLQSPPDRGCDFRDPGRGRNKHYGKHGKRRIQAEATASGNLVRCCVQCPRWRSEARP
jgi:hypothetical protein